MIINNYTFQIKSGNAELDLTFTISGSLITTHYVSGALVKRVSVTTDKIEAEQLLEWLALNLKRDLKPRVK